MLKGVACAFCSKQHLYFDRQFIVFESLYNVEPLAKNKRFIQIG
jgi:hypothetical protein